ncbi:MAG: Ig-like domain-containing protein, partial [Mycobacteriales bacterium]
MRRRPLALLMGAGLAATAVLTAPAVFAAGAVALLDGTTPETAAFPNDRFTVADAAQLTGRRVALPVPACTEDTRSTCDALALLDTLDGFDLQPRVFLPFSGDIDVATVTPATVYVEGAGRRIGLQQLTFDPALDLLAGTTREQLQEQTSYVLVVTRSVRDSSGRPLAREVRTPFTTMSGTTELDRLRRALDDGSAYDQAGITTRAASFSQTGTTTVFPPAFAELITRRDQRSADPTAPLVSAPVPNLAVAGAGCYAFGSIESPQFARTDSTVPPTPSGSTPQALGKQRIGFALIVPAGPAPAGGWPTAVYGPGFTRSYFDLFVTSDLNAAAGIATLATDPLGHGYGPASQVSVGLPGAQTTFLSYGRGRDLDGDGAIGDQEGSQPTQRIGPTGEQEPSPNALHGLRGGLIQTVVDNMALVRAVRAGITVPGCTLSPGAKLATERVKYYGLSFGGIYGTMLLGTDPTVRTGLLNVPGGPVVDIARLSGFRPLLADTLRVSKPSLLNGGPGLDGFTESIP